MTALDHHMPAVRDRDVPAVRDQGVRRAPGGTSREVDDTATAHVLRLCLDLQLDALLLALGATAAQQVRQDAPAGSTPSDPLPWRRWVAEDVDLVATLAADAMAGRATLPSALGNEVDHRVPATVVDGLAARYESMRDLLTDLLDRDSAWDPGGRRPQVLEALHRCGTRLVELREGRRAGPPDRRTDAPEPSTSGSPLAPEHRYLPGELLG